MRERVNLKSPVREYRPPGSVRGAPGNRCPYLDKYCPPARLLPPDATPFTPPSRSEHTQQEKVNATWLTECVQSLAWCMGLVELNPFRRCDDDLASHFPAPFTDPSGFISDAVLRPLDEIYQQADLHYRLHWADRNARLIGTQCSVDEGLISERRKPLDWVIGVEADRDEIPLDT